MPIHGPMEDAGILKLYEPGPIQCLYVAPVDHIMMVGRVPLIPLFLAGNSTPTIPHKFSKHKASGFPMGCADSASSDGRRGSSVYEVNIWLWNFGRGKPRRQPFARKRRERTKPIVLLRLVGAGGRMERDQMKFAVFS